MGGKWEGEWKDGRVIEGGCRVYGREWKGGRVVEGGCRAYGMVGEYRKVGGRVGKTACRVYGREIVWKGKWTGGRVVGGGRRGSRREIEGVGRRMEGRKSDKGEYSLYGELRK